MARGSFSLQLDVAAIREQIGKLRQGAAAAVEHALRVVATELLIDAKLHVPILTGALKDSGRVEEIDFGEALKVARVIFGDTREIVYAAIQHDIPFNHPSLGFFGAAKYLEKPLATNLRFYTLLFASEYELALRGRV